MREAQRVRETETPVFTLYSITKFPKKQGVGGKNKRMEKKAGKIGENPEKVEKYLTKKDVRNRAVFTNFDFGAKYLQTEGAYILTNWTE